MPRVTVVDDSQLARSLTKWTLAPSGIEFQEIEPQGLEQVMEALRAAPPDLLLLDVQMPACPGQALLETIRRDAQLSDLPVVLLTAVGDEEVLKPFVALGIAGYLHKPVNAKSLMVSVQEALGMEA